MTTDYEKRLKIPISGDPDRHFYTHAGELLAIGYMRVCIGARGPYIEFKRDHFLKDILEEQQGKGHYYFTEYKTIPGGLFVYHQLHEVDYADYRVGFYYLSPFDLCSPAGVPVIEPMCGTRVEQLPLFPTK